MSPPIDNNVDWTVPSTPGGERVGPGLSRPKDAQATAAKPQRSVMDKLLGENALSAYDPAGNDPYNTTGRQFRR
jgi:hypothetical protein